MNINLLTLDFQFNYVRQYFIGMVFEMKYDHEITVAVGYFHAQENLQRIDRGDDFSMIILSKLLLFILKNKLIGMNHFKEISWKTKKPQSL